MEKIFADGFIFKLPQGNTPDFIKGKVSIKVDDFVKFLEEHKSETGWVSIDLKQSRKGSVYGELNTWKPKSGAPKEIFEEPTPEIPF